MVSGTEMESPPKVVVRTDSVELVERDDYIIYYSFPATRKSIFFLAVNRTVIVLGHIDRLFVQ